MERGVIGLCWEGPVQVYGWDGTGRAWRELGGCFQPGGGVISTHPGQDPSLGLQLLLNTDKQQKPNKRKNPTLFNPK